MIASTLVLDPLKLSHHPLCIVVDYGADSTDSLIVNSTPAVRTHLNGSSSDKSAASSVLSSDAPDSISRKIKVVADAGIYVSIVKSSPWERQADTASITLS